MTHHDKIAVRIRELVPEIVKQRTLCPKCEGETFVLEHSDNHGQEGECINCPVQVRCFECQGLGFYSPRPIQLADVLRAVEMCNKGMYELRTGEKEFTIDNWVGDFFQYWNLSHDYDHQSDEVKDFIGTLLGVNK